MTGWPFRLVKIFGCVVVIAFTVLALLPTNLASNTAIRCAFALVILLLISTPWIMRTSQALNARCLELLPFLIFLTYTTYTYALEKGYHFGFDDSYYYSYAPSLILDKDLDLTNQYQLSGLPAEIFALRTPTGALKNEFPLGCALYWMPFFLLGHGLTLLLNAFGSVIPTDGYSQIYLNAVIFGNIFYCFVGLFATYLFISNHFRKSISAFATLTVWITTPLYVYSTRIFLVSETLSMFSVALFLLMTMMYQKKPRQLTVFLLGLAGAMATMVRLHNAIFLLFPATLLLKDLVSTFRGGNGKLFKITLIHTTFMLIGFFIGFLPQFVVWKALYGEWVVNAGQYLLWLKHPFVLEVLFSSRKGLFPWSPILVFACIGLTTFTRKEKLWGWLFILALLINIYLNSSQWDWWGSTAFGGRRFTNCTLIFASGLSAFIHFLTTRWQKRGWIAGMIIIALFINLNVFLTRAYRRGKLQYDHADRFADVLQGSFYPLFKPIVYALEFPVQSYYCLRYGIRLYHPENEFFIGDDILYFQQRHGNLVLGADTPLFGSGWKSRETWIDGAPVRLTTSQKAVLNLPLFFKYETNLTMQMKVRTVTKQHNDVWLDLYLNDLLLFSRKISDKSRTVRVNLFKYPYLKRVNLLRVEISRHAGTEHHDSSLPAIELQALEFVASDFVRPESITH